MLSARIISAVVFFVLFFLGLFNPWFTWVLPALLTLAVLMSLYEFMHFGRGAPPLIFQALAFLGAIALLIDAYHHQLSHALMILGSLTVLSLGAGTLKVEPHFTEVTGKCLIGTLYVTLPFALIMLIWRQAIKTDNMNGQHYLIFLVLGTQCSDIGAYFVGRWLGRHPFAPRLSPKKTWEGFFGGMAFTLLVTCLFRLSWNNIANIFTWGEVVFLAVMFSVIGPIGDLTESWLKRNAGVKDSGRTWTGHGGMLDIIDSLLFTTIFYYIYLWLTHRPIFLPL